MGMRCQHCERERVRNMDKLKCLRIYSDAQGKLHFGEIEVDVRLIDCAAYSRPHDEWSEGVE